MFQTFARDQRDVNFTSGAIHLRNFIQAHFARSADRLLERYNLSVTFGQWESLNERVYREENVEFLFKPNVRTACYILNFQKKDVACFFSTTVFCITTFLPPEDCRLRGIRPRDLI